MADKGLGLMNSIAKMFGSGAKKKLPAKPAVPKPPGEEEEQTLGQRIGYPGADKANGGQVK